MGKRNQEDYESDGGFIEDAPKTKKLKGSRVHETKRPVVSNEVHVDDEGNEYWEVGALSYLTAAQF